MRSGGTTGKRRYDALGAIRSRLRFVASHATATRTHFELEREREDRGKKMNGGVRERPDANSRRLTTRKRRLVERERERERDCLCCCHSDPSCQKRP